MALTPDVESVNGLLVVDDDEAFRNRLVRALKDREFNTNGAADVQSGIKTIKGNSKIRRVIVDLKMPGRSGLDLVQAASHIRPEIEVIVLTGYGTIASATAAIKLGAVNYLTKPVTVDQILKAFEETAHQLDQFAVPSLSQVEWDHIQRVIADCSGNISHAAKKLGMHRRSLQRKLQKSPGTLK